MLSFKDLHLLLYFFSNPTACLKCLCTMWRWHCNDNRRLPNSTVPQSVVESYPGYRSQWLHPGLRFLYYARHCLDCKCWVCLSAVNRALLLTLVWLAHLILQMSHRFTLKVLKIEYLYSNDYTLPLKLLRVCPMKEAIAPASGVETKSKMEVTSNFSWVRTQWSPSCVTSRASRENGELDIEVVKL